MALRKLASEACSRWGLACYAEPTHALSASALSVSRFFATVKEDRKYAKSHEWVKVDGDTATVGISEFAQSELGDVVYVELPSVGENLERNEAFGVVESVKAASDVYAPVSGEVTETNEELSDNPSLVNSGPFEDGWLMKVKMSKKEELDELMDPQAYKSEIE